MPITNIINDDEKVIYTTCSGAISTNDFNNYLSVRAHDQYSAYNELFCTLETSWEDFDFANLHELAKSFTASNSSNSNLKLAWVIPEGKQNIFTDFYDLVKTYRDSNSLAVEAFYSRDKALNWLTNNRVENNSSLSSLFHETL